MFYSENKFFEKIEDYKGYEILESFDYPIMEVTRDGYLHISWATNLTEAKIIIDNLLDD